MVVAELVAPQETTVLHTLVVIVVGRDFPEGTNTLTVCKQMGAVAVVQPVLVEDESDRVLVDWL